MGYTNYYRRPAKAHEQEAWNAFYKACKELYKNMPEHSHSAGDHYPDAILFLTGCNAYKHPQFNKERVLFNGGVPGERTKTSNKYGQSNWDGYQHTDPAREAEDNELAHETFSLTREYVDAFAFCKTARKPYDLMVKACLILYKYFFPYVTISSDGDEEDWMDAKKFVAAVHPTIALKSFLSGNFLGK